jgi:hypothetical protein
MFNFDGTTGTTGTLDAMWPTTNTENAWITVSGTSGVGMTLTVYVENQSAGASGPFQIYDVDTTTPGAYTIYPPALYTSPNLAANALEFRTFEVVPQNTGNQIWMFAADINTTDIRLWSIQ